MTPEVSILIPTRHRTVELREAILSLGAQDFERPFEVIVMEDGSSEGTRKVVNEAAALLAGRVAVHYHAQPAAHSANAARNAALVAARGRIVVFTDDDVLAPPGWLRALVNALEAGTHDVVTGPVRLMLGAPPPVKHAGELASYLTEVSAPVSGYPISADAVPVMCNMAARREVFDRAAFGADVSAPVEEVDWSLRARASVGFSEDAWLWHNKQGDILRVSRLLRIAWQRGRERGWWLRRRQDLPFAVRLGLARRAAATMLRSAGHAGRHRCWGGALTAVGELTYALALVGVLERKRR